MTFFNLEELSRKITEIKFSIVQNPISIIINNDNANKISKQINFDINSITRLELLNNFYGEISSIIITKGLANEILALKK